jgi:hypothetical protein
MYSPPTHLDTATTIPLSHHGHRSQVGMWLKSHAELRGCVLVATKFGEQFDTDTGRTAVDLSAAAAERCLDASERLLGRVDILYSHVTSQVGECTLLFLSLRCARAHTPSRSTAFTLVVTRDRPELVWCVTSFSTKTKEVSLATALNLFGVSLLFQQEQKKYHSRSLFWYACRYLLTRHVQSFRTRR